MELEQRLVNIENKAFSIDLKVDKLISRVDSIGGNISIIAERITRPKVLPTALVIMNIAGWVFIAALLL